MVASTARSTLAPAVSRRRRPERRQYPTTKSSSDAREKRAPFVAPWLERGCRSCARTARTSAWMKRMDDRIAGVVRAGEPARLRRLPPSLNAIQSVVGASREQSQGGLGPRNMRLRASDGSDASRCNVGRSCRESDARASRKGRMPPRRRPAGHRHRQDSRVRRRSDASATDRHRHQRSAALHHRRGRAAPGMLGAVTRRLPRSSLRPSCASRVSLARERAAPSSSLQCEFPAEIDESITACGCHVGRARRCREDQPPRSVSFERVGGKKRPTSIAIASKGSIRAMEASSYDPTSIQARDAWSRRRASSVRSEGSSSQ